MPRVFDYPFATVVAVRLRSFLVVDLHYGQFVLLGKVVVTGVVGRNGHDGAGAVAQQHVIGYPDGDFLFVGRIDSV